MWFLGDYAEQLGSSNLPEAFARENCVLKICGKTPRTLRMSSWKTLVLGVRKELFFFFFSLFNCFPKWIIWTRWPWKVFPCLAFSDQVTCWSMCVKWSRSTGLNSPWNSLASLVQWGGEVKIGHQEPFAEVCGGDRGMLWYWVLSATCLRMQRETSRDQDKRVVNHVGKVEVPTL